MMPPSVCVVIPCYAQAHFLADAIESVLAQTYRPDEIIVVDDGSPDDVPAVTRAYPAVRLVRQENRGLSQARNRGLAEGRGDYVVFLDADDRLLPEALRAGVEALSEHPGCAFVWGFRRLIDAGGNVLPDQPKDSYAGLARYDLLLRENIVGPPVSVMFRRSALVATGGFNDQVKYTEDYELFLRIVRSQDAWCHRQLVAEYRVHGANMSLNYRGMLEGNLRTLELQEGWIGADAGLRRALKAGRRTARRHYDGWPRLDELSKHARGKRWGKAVACATALLYRYPGMFVPMLLRRMKRALVPTSSGMG